MPTARFWILNVSGLLTQTLDPFLQAKPIVSHIKKGRARVDIILGTRGRDPIRSFIHKQFEPRLQLPCIEQRGFFVEEVLDVASGDRKTQTLLPDIRRSHSRQNTRICSSSFETSACCPMPLEMSFHAAEERFL